MAVAAVSYAITMYSAGAVITTVTVTATIGFGLSVAGYCLKNPVLSAIGGIMSGFAGGYSMAGAAGWSDLVQAANGIMGASASFLNSPLSPLDAQTRQIVGWAWSAYGVAVSVSNMFGNDYVKAAGADQNVSFQDGDYADFVAPLSNASNSREVLLASAQENWASDASFSPKYKSSGAYAAGEAHVVLDCEYWSGGEVIGGGHLTAKVYLVEAGVYNDIGDVSVVFSGLTNGYTPLGYTKFRVGMTNMVAGTVSLDSFSGTAAIATGSAAFGPAGLSATYLRIGSMRSTARSIVGTQSGVDASADLFYGISTVSRP